MYEPHRHRAEGERAASHERGVRAKSTFHIIARSDHDVAAVGI